MNEKFVPCARCFDSLNAIEPELGCFWFLLCEGRSPESPHVFFVDEPPSSPDRPEYVAYAIKQLERRGFVTSYEHHDRQNVYVIRIEGFEKQLAFSNGASVAYRICGGIHK